MRFRLLMSYHDLGLRDIAEATGCGVSTVGTWKNGRVPSSRKVVEKLAKLFGVTPEFLLEGKVGEPAASAQNLGSGAANRILRDIEELLQELGDSELLREPPPPPFADKTAGEAEAEGGPTRSGIESYMRVYLDLAEKHPHGLSHTWVQLRREFPLDLFQRIS